MLVAGTIPLMTRSAFGILKQGHDLLCLVVRAVAPAVALTHEGRYAITGSNDYKIRIWDLKQGVELRALTGHMGVILDLVVFSDNRRALSTSSDETFKVWDLQAGKELFTVRNRYDTALAITPDDRLLVSAADFEDVLHVWDLKRAERLPLADTNLRAHHNTVTPDGRWLVIGATTRPLKYGMWSVSRYTQCSGATMKMSRRWLSPPIASIW